jgi:hypothetical protein
MRDGFLLFMQRLPTLLKFWAAGAVAVTVLMMIAGSPILEAMGSGAAFLGMAIALLPVIWQNPFTYPGDMTWRRALVAYVWFAVTAFPAVALSVFLARAISAR